MSIEDGLDFVAGRLEALASGIAVTPPAEGDSFFKFISLNSHYSWELFEQTMLKLQLKGSVASSLNDPFELSPVLFDDLRDENFIEKISRTRNPFLQKAEQPLVSKEDALSVVGNYVDQLRSSNHIVSFSARADSPLLWAHYANGYKGACIHFVGARTFGIRVRSFGRVDYRFERSVVPLSNIYKIAREKSARSSEQLRNLVEKVHFFEKSQDWSYEREIRALHSSRDGSALNIEPMYIRSIIFGPRMTSEDKDRIKRIVSLSLVPTLPLLESNLSKRSFSVEIDWTP